MDSPPYLFDQFAKTCGVSTAMAKRAIMLKGFAAEGRSLHHTCQSLDIPKASAQKLARRFIIDFSDYRPYAAKERKGIARPDPYSRDVMLPASGLPLFAS